MYWYISGLCVVRFDGQDAACNVSIRLSGCPQKVVFEAGYSINSPPVIALFFFRIYGLLVSSACNPCLVYLRPYSVTCDFRPMCFGSQTRALSILCFLRKLFRQLLHPLAGAANLAQAATPGPLQAEGRALLVLLIVIAVHLVPGRHVIDVIAHHVNLGENHRTWHLG